MLWHVTTLRLVMYQCRKYPLSTLSMHPYFNINQSKIWRGKKAYAKQRNRGSGKAKPPGMVERPSEVTSGVTPGQPASPTTTHDRNIEKFLEWDFEAFATSFFK